MSGEQRDNNLGIDPELRNEDPLEYMRKLLELKKKQETGFVEFVTPPKEDALPEGEKKDQPPSR